MGRGNRSYGRALHRSKKRSHRSELGLLPKLSLSGERRGRVQNPSSPNEKTERRSSRSRSKGVHRGGDAVRRRGTRSEKKKIATKQNMFLLNKE